MRDPEKEPKKNEQYASETASDAAPAEGAQDPQDPQAAPEQESAEAPKRKRFRVLTLAGAVALVLAVAGGGGYFASQHLGGAGGGTDDAKPAGEKQQRGSASTGSRAAPSEFTVWEDFRCPACGQFEKMFRPKVNSLVKQGKLRVRYHPVTIIDDNLGGHGSRRAANAALCARDEGRFREFHDLLFQYQPVETQDAFADRTTLMKLGYKAGVRDPAFNDCVRKGRHDRDVAASTAAFRSQGYAVTPTVLLDGENLLMPGSKFTPATLERRVEAKAKAADRD